MSPLPNAVLLRTWRETMQLEEWRTQLATVADLHRRAAAAIDATAEKRGDMLAGERRQRDTHLSSADEIERMHRDSAIDYRQIIDVGMGPSSDNTASFSGGRWHTGGDHTYRKGDDSRSFLRDLLTRERDPEAMERLVRNTKEVSESRGLTLTPGAGGEFAPPLYLVDDFISIQRGDRVVADQVAKMPLPPGTQSVRLPRMSSGTNVDAQTAELTAFANVDAQFEEVQADVETLGGTQVLSIQSIERSALSLDRVVIPDLLSIYAQRVDEFVISVNKPSQYKVGLLNVAGRNVVTYTDASPTAAELYPKLADGITRVATGRRKAAQKIFMHPRRWGWLTAQTDTTGRPLVTPAAQMPQNVQAAMGAVVAEGFVGSLQGLPVYTDANLPIGLGAGTNEDAIIAARTDDITLMESPPMVQVLRERYADIGGVGIVLHGYVALFAHRYPESISVVTGTGLTPPPF